MIDLSTATRRPVPGAERDAAIESFIPVCHHLTKRYAHWSLDADDLFQLAMLATIVAVDGYDPACEFTLGQSVGQAIKFALGHEFKRIKRLCRSSGDLPDVIADDSADSHDDVDDACDLRNAVEDLPRKDKAILVRFYGLDGKRAASRETLGKRYRVSVTTISKSTSRSVSRLRRALSA